MLYIVKLIRSTKTFVFVGSIQVVSVVDTSYVVRKVITTVSKKSWNIF